MKNRAIKLTILILALGILIPAVSATPPQKLVIKGICNQGKLGYGTTWYDASAKFTSVTRPHNDGFVGLYSMVIKVDVNGKIMRIPIKKLGVELTHEEGVIQSFTVEINGQYLPVKNIVQDGLTFTGTIEAEGLKLSETEKLVNAFLPFTFKAEPRSKDWLPFE